MIFLSEKKELGVCYTRNPLFVVSAKEHINFGCKEEVKNFLYKVYACSTFDHKYDGRWSSNFYIFVSRMRYTEVDW